MDFRASLLKNIGSDLPAINSNNAFWEDGMYYCRVCRKPKQTYIELSDGKHLVRKACDCERKRYEQEEQEERKKRDLEAILRLRSESMMDELSKTHTFERFQATSDNVRNKTICEKYAREFDRMKEKNQGLLMLGNPGTGKTFSASCIANYLINQKRRVIMTSFVKLISIIQNGSKETEQEIIEKLNSAELLIIDDLGAERGTDYAIERVYNIVDSRYRSRKPLVLTTNLSLQEMKETSDIRLARIYDRVFEICYPMQFTGKSMRHQEAARRFDEMKEFLEG